MSVGSKRRHFLRSYRNIGLNSINNVFRRRSIYTYVTFIRKFFDFGRYWNHSYSPQQYAWEKKEVAALVPDYRKIMYQIFIVRFFSASFLMLSCRSISLDSIFVRAQLIRLKNESRTENPVQCETEQEKMWEKHCYCCLGSNMDISAKRLNPIPARCFECDVVKDLL